MTGTGRTNHAAPSSLSASPSSYLSFVSSARAHAKAATTFVLLGSTTPPSFHLSLSIKRRPSADPFPLLISPINRVFWLLISCLIKRRGAVGEYKHGEERGEREKGVGAFFTGKGIAFPLNPAAPLWFPAPCDFGSGSSCRCSVLGSRRTTDTRGVHYLGVRRVKAGLRLLRAEMEAADPLEHELQREVSDITVRNCITGLHREFETKLWEHRTSICRLNMTWKENVSAIAGELSSILSVVMGSESGTHPSSHISGLEKTEDHCSTVMKVKDDSEPRATEKATTTESSQVVLEIPDFSLLKHMQSEEITNFLRSEWLKLRRQHESELHEKTEELFRVKREFAKEKSLSPLRKERELEFVKSKLLQTIAKLGEMGSRKENSYLDYNENDEMCRLTDRIGSLLHENECLHGQLADKGEENKRLSSQVLNAKSQIARGSLSEAKLLNHVEKLRDELEDLRIERHLNSLLDSCIFTEVFGNYQSEICDMNQEFSFLKELLIEKDDQLNIIYEDRQKLKYENDQLVSIAGSTIMQHHERANLVNDELMMFREKVCEQEILILESKSESNSIKSCLYEALQQIHVCKEEMRGLTENLSYMSIALEEAKKQNASLDATIREMKKAPAQCIGNHMGQTGSLELDFADMEKLWKAYSDFESRVAEAMKRNEARLTRIICQINPLVQQVAVLKKKEFWYKQILEIKCSNLQKAEAEVDLLGDEVDALLSVLGKIYIALDHYSPVLKHYPGVIDILMLVQKVLKGESI